MRLLSSCLLAATAALLLLPLAHAQSSSPPRRAHHALVYDPANQRILLSGGSTPVDGGSRFVFFNDLWAFDGTRWTRLGASGDSLSGIRMVFDAQRQRVVSFGGFDQRSRGDLRALEGNAWRTIGAHAEMPSAEPGFAYDTRRDRFIAFGGSASRWVTHGDTWEYDGSEWSKLAVANPPARQAHAMVYDERRGRTVLFGGMGSAPEGQRPPILGDTWEYDGSAWVARQVAGPSPRIGPGMAYDSRRGLVILFGGSGSGSSLGDTWSWDGTTWRMLADVGPPPRSMGQLAYDAGRDRIVLFGGRDGYPDGDLDDTWEWDGEVWRRVVVSPHTPSGAP